MKSSQAMADVAEQAFNQSITNTVFLTLFNFQKPLIFDGAGP